ncbi:MULTISPECIES: hypothetical protein [unclassified Mesorhizobium]|uniref:hypothetical protein n=1 Tax=unclassified Mesorhizobium TaxID=325217 RepID=UPI000FCBCE5D|nr:MULTISPECIES: hypothetical protein [unclassified Mesorhizobium]RVD54549.1 hypothetical protein EN783_30435 [Mesorhizobium sp. M2D.F.Ca.ET.140.01.1.1]TGP69402.1 hypothetical protein EN867_31015 [Mesorhizobium sp. M2D.F.Ca.ET.224.01.1.1]TGP86622.1 hypothetical protein EN865_31010 [bacterium M00.F.Ca.ET.222.01.1.1]
MSEDDLQKKIRRQMDADFRSDPRKAYEQHGLTATLRRGVLRTAMAAAVILAGFLVWTALHH